jgi:hypothetical protein
VQDLREHHPLAALLKAAGLVRSTFYYQLKALDRGERHAGLKEKIRTLYEHHKGRYGYRRITAAIRQAGELVNHKTVQRLMGQLQLKSLVRPKKYRSWRGEVGRAAPNLLQRQFKADGPNQKWVTDVTEFKVGAQRLYLSPVMDLYNGEIVAYQMDSRPSFELVSGMLKKALTRLRGNERPLLHSDQGWQGGFNRSSQHSIIEQTSSIRPGLRPVSSNQAFSGVWSSVHWRRPGSLGRSTGTGLCPLESIAAEGRSCSRSCRAAMDCAGRRRIPLPRTRP